MCSYLIHLSCKRFLDFTTVEVDCPRYGNFDTERTVLGVITSDFLTFEIR